MIYKQKKKITLPHHGQKPQPLPCVHNKKLINIYLREQSFIILPGRQRKLAICDRDKKIYSAKRGVNRIVLRYIKGPNRIENPKNGGHACMHPKIS